MRKEVETILMALMFTTKEIFADADKAKKVFADDKARLDKELDKIAEGSAELVHEVASLIDRLYND